MFENFFGPTTANAPVYFIRLLTARQTFCVCFIQHKMTNGGDFFFNQRHFSLTGTDFFHVLRFNSPSSPFFFVFLLLPIHFTPNLALSVQFVPIVCLLIFPYSKCTYLLLKYLSTRALDVHQSIDSCVQLHFSLNNLSTTGGSMEKYSKASLAMIFEYIWPSSLSLNVFIFL